MAKSNIVTIVIGGAEFWTGTVNTTTAKQSDLPYTPGTPDAMAANDYTMAIGAGVADAEMIIGSASYLTWQDLTVDNGPARGNVNTTRITALKWLNPCEANPGVPTGGIVIPTTGGGTLIIPPGNPGQVLVPGDNPGDPPYWVDLPPSSGNGYWEKIGNGIYYNDGLVGIGTDVPLSPLHVSGQVSGEVARFQARKDDSNNGSFISLFASNPSFWWEIWNADSAEGGVTNDLRFKSRNGSGEAVEKLTLIGGSGNVGIGTTNPDVKLHVSGGNIRLDDTQSIEFGDTNNFIDGNVSLNMVRIVTNNTERLRIDQFGNVGISTTTPSYKLDVNGTSRANQFLTNRTTLANNTAISAGTISIGNRYLISISANGGEYFFGAVRYGAVTNISNISFSVVVGNGTLSGTTGPSGTINVRDNNGTLWIENRVGGARNIGWIFLGGD